MEGRNWPWKIKLSKVLKWTLVLFLWGYILTLNPDFYECPKCGRKKPLG